MLTAIKVIAALAYILIVLTAMAAGLALPVVLIWWLVTHA